MSELHFVTAKADGMFEGEAVSWAGCFDTARVPTLVACDYSALAQIYLPVRESAMASRTLREGEQRLHKRESARSRLTPTRCT